MVTIARKQTEITSPVIYRCTDKVTHECYYLVKSDSQDHTFYEVHFDHSALLQRCNCVATTRQCKHVRAVNEILKLRRIRLAAAMGGDMPKTIARMQFEEDSRLQEQERKEVLPTDQKGHLHSAAGFSLLK